MDSENLFRRAHDVLTDLESAYLSAIDNEIESGRLTRTVQGVTAELQWPYEGWDVATRGHKDFVLRFYVEGKQEQSQPPSAAGLGGGMAYLQIIDEGDGEIIFAMPVHSWGVHKGRTAIRVHCVQLFQQQQQPQPPTEETVADQPGDAGDNPPVDPGVGRS